MGFGSSRTGAFTALVPCLPMFFSTWETYHTHTLYLGYFNGPTEGLIGACLFMIASGIWGPGIWSLPLYPYLPKYVQFLYPARGTWLAQYINPTTNVQDIWVVFILTTFLVAHVPECVGNVHRARKAKGLSTWPLILEWTPLALFTAGCTLWLGSPHSYILADNHLVLYALTMSLVFGRMTTKIILAHLTRQPFPYWTFLLFPLLAGAAISYLPEFGYETWDAEQEMWYLRGYLIFGIIAYSHWAYIVIDAICRYLKINALTIPKEKVQAARAKRAAEKQRQQKAKGLANGAVGKSKATANGTHAKSD
jgi:ethanolaminephosphotransferase